MPSFQLSLVSPEKLLFAGQVDQVDLPGVEGDFGVLAGHAPIVAMLRPGIWLRSPVACTRNSWCSEA